MLYNISEFLTTLKEDMEIKDVPLPVDDNVLIDRIDRSALREFSVRYPYITDIVITSEDAIDLAQRCVDGSITYIIPAKYYQGTEIIDVLGLNPGGYGSEANMYMPSIVLGSADSLIESIADIKMAAALGSVMTHAPTHRFDPPNRLSIYNGWNSASYRVEIALKHDISLSTIPPGAFTDFRQLCVLDLEQFLYGKMKRLTNLETGVGTITLNIDSWEGAGREKRELLEKWDENASLDTARIGYF